MYKGLKNEQLTIKIRAHRTSQECSRCGHTLPDNRETPTVFTCQNCGFTTNADYNASLIIKNRGIRVVLGGTIVAKQKTSFRFRKKSQKYGGDCPNQSGHPWIAVPWMDWIKPAKRLV